MTKSKEQALMLDSLSVERLRRLVDGLPDAAVVIDDNLRPLVWNVAYVQVVGLRARRFRDAANTPGTRCCDLLSLEICENACLAKRVREEQRPLRVDEIRGHSMLVPDKADSTLIVSAIPLEDANGHVGAVLELYRDVTAEVRIQSRYKVLLEQEQRRAEILEEQVRLRTADLESSLEELRATRAQLIQSEKLSSLGQLVAGIAHEINNPINFIYGNTEFLRTYVEAFLKLIQIYDEVSMPAADRDKVERVKKEIDFDYMVEDVRNVIRSIRGGAERTTAIIRDLRAFIHGRTLEHGPVDLVNCVETSLSLLSHDLRHRIKINREGVEDVPTIGGHQGHLNQVFMNLLLNAAQAIDRSGTITVRFSRRDDGVAIDVIDTGCGIVDSDLLKVFDPFFTTKPVGEGTGLGLSLSYSIVGAHGGKITVESEVGKGSTFTVWLPVSNEQPKEMASEQ